MADTLRPCGLGRARVIQPTERPSEVFEIDQLRKVIHHLNVALARCQSILAELERPADNLREVSEAKRLQ